MLGPLRVRDGADWVPVRAGQQRVVLAVLLANAQQVVSTEQLAYEVWGARPPRTSVKTVQVYLMRLRRLLGDDALVTRDHGYELVVDADGVDALVFERLVASARHELAQGRLAPALVGLSEALALWHGPVLPDVVHGPLLTPRVAHLEQTRLGALEDRLDTLLRLDRHAEAVDELQWLVEEHPLRERLWANLISALHGCGRRAEALDAFRRARRVLVDELGLEPGPILADQQRAILAADSVRASVPPPRTGPSGVLPAQLPPDVAGFSGRDRQLEQLDAALLAGTDSSATEAVIVAIAGPAGVGKTALAVHWAHRVRDRYPDGQLYLDLRGYSDSPPMSPARALGTLLYSLGVPTGPAPSDVDRASALYRSLMANRRMLILLDNADRPDQIRPLLPGDATSAVLVTSRDRLAGLVARDGAVPVTLDVLTDDDAYALLARLLGPGRVNDEPEATGELIKLCGHLPLALRVAAANLSAHPHTTVADYAVRLSRDLLTGLEVDGDRQSGVRATFDLSYAALPDRGRWMFRLLGLLPGPEVTASAAAALTGSEPAEAERLLARLDEVHLVTEHAPGRYRLHGLLRRYAIERATTEESAQRQAALSRLYGVRMRHGSTSLPDCPL